MPVVLVVVVVVVVVVVESVAVVDVGAALLLNKVRNSSVQTFFS